MIVVNLENGRGYNGSRDGIPRWSVREAVRFTSRMAVDLTVEQLRAAGFVVARADVRSLRSVDWRALKRATA
jgi:hypothetical protein